MSSPVGGGALGGGSPPAGFFDRLDPSRDTIFYDQPRLVTHIDQAAVDSVGDLYEELSIEGDVLDLMGSWTSHFRRAPRRLSVLGMNPVELAANPAARHWVVADLNADPQLPFGDRSFDAVVCCVSVDYLVRPVAVFSEVARVLRAGGPFVCTFSDRCFPTKAIRGWLTATDEERCEIVAGYFERSPGWGPPVVQRRTAPEWPGDPLFAVWATRMSAPAI
ncbi:MAG TPA: class I SAM-dependent methyltransferase [Acidimicrobiales bacterium]